MYMLIDISLLHPFNVVSMWAIILPPGWLIDPFRVTLDARYNAS